MISEEEREEERQELAKKKIELNSKVRISNEYRIEAIEEIIFAKYPQIDCYAKIVNELNDSNEFYRE